MHSGRIASLNLCADQLLVAMLPHARIAALGPFARDPSISFVAESARAFAQLTGRGEELATLSAAALLTGPFDNKLTIMGLQRRQVRIVMVDRWTTLASASRGIRELADLLGVQSAGQRIVDDIDRELHALRRRAARRDPGDTFLIVHRRGYVAHGEILSEILEAAGLRDLAAAAAPRFLGAEAILSMRPRILVLVSDENARIEDRGMELLQHPALHSAYPADRRLLASDRLTICPGPATPHLIRSIGSQLDGLRAAR